MIRSKKLMYVKKRERMVVKKQTMKNTQNIYVENFDK